jgi:hypothetical protein
VCEAVFLAMSKVIGGSSLGFDGCHGNAAALIGRGPVVPSSPRASTFSTTFTPPFHTHLRDQVLKPNNARESPSACEPGRQTTISGEHHPTSIGAPLAVPPHHCPALQLDLTTAENT